MPDSSQQPRPESTIDFLHNGSSGSPTSSKSKKDEQIEYMRSDTTQATSPPRLRSMIQRMVSGIRRVLHVQTFATGQIHPEEHRADTTKESSQKVPDSGGRRRAVEETTSVSDPQISSNNPLSQTQPMIGGGQTKGRPLEKIPLNKFRDGRHSEDVNDRGTLKNGASGFGAPRGISSPRDHGEGGGDMDVNLLPEQRRSMSPTTKRGIAIALLSFEFIGLLVGFLVLQAKADGRLLGSRELESQQTLLDIQMKQYREVVKEASSLQRRAGMLREILEQRPDILGMISWFESHTVDSVYLEDLSISKGGSVHVRVVAPNAEDAAHQMNLFSSTKSWKEVHLSSITFENHERSPRVVFDAQLSGFLGLGESAL